MFELPVQSRLPDQFELKFFDKLEAIHFLFQALTQPHE